MHLHAGHVHIHVEFHVADVDGLTVAIAEFDYNIVVAFAQATCGAKEVNGQVIDGLRDEWPA